MKTIYVKLLDEGTDVWRPVAAIQGSDSNFTISKSQNIPKEEQWEFGLGQKVKCKYQDFSENKRRLVAYKLVD